MRKGNNIPRLQGGRLARRYDSLADKNKKSRITAQSDTLIYRLSFLFDNFVFASKKAEKSFDFENMLLVNIFSALCLF